MNDMTNFKIKLSDGGEYTMEDATNAKPIPSEVLQKCDDYVLKMMFNAQEATIEYAEEQIAKVRTIIEIAGKIVENAPDDRKPDKQQKLDELNAALADIESLISDLTEQQERIALTLAERGQFPGEAPQEAP